MSTPNSAAIDAGAARRVSFALPVLDGPDSFLSRRAFVCTSALSLLGLTLTTGCGASDATNPYASGGHGPPAGSTTFVGGVLVIALASVPDLTASNGHVVIGMTDATGNRADLIVINVAGVYRAFSSICTHEGCTVTGFSGMRMQCPCHGSEFDLNGAPVAGPAPRALREYTTALNSGAGTLTITVV